MPPEAKTIMNGNEEQSAVCCHNRSKSFYRLSIFFGLLPQVIGGCIFVLWYFTRADGFVSAGIVTIVCGAFSVLNAFFFLVAYLYRERRRNTSARILFKKGLISGGVMIANFPLALLLVHVVLTIMTMYHLTIRNESSSPVSRMVITAPGISKILEQLEPNERIAQQFHFEQDGDLRYSFCQNETEYAGIIEGYVTHSQGGKAVLVIQDDGKHEIIKREPD